ncbi:MAG: hypothetical protein HXY41_07085 [Chloroflexi bacterium]|nr:hypothetical protein [Chloroflexota bacterium]
MPILVEWDSLPTNRLLLISFSGSWGWEDVRVAVEDACRKLDTASSPVNLIVHVTGAVLLPPNFKANVQALVRDIHPKTGLIVMVLPKILNEIVPIFSALNGGMGFEYRFAPTLEAARQILKTRGTPE